MRYGLTINLFGCKPFCFDCAHLAFEELSHTGNKAFYRFRVRHGGMHDQDQKRLERRFKGTNFSWSAR